MALKLEKKLNLNNFVKIVKFKDDEGNVILKPAICYFCGEPIVKLEGCSSESLAIHSLDENHDNWNKDNKVPTHRGCHTKFHKSGEKCNWFGRDNSGEKNPNFGKRGVETSQFGKDHSKTGMFGKHQTEAWKTKIGEGNKKYCANITPEEKAEQGRKNSESTKNFWANMTLEQRKEHKRKVQEGIRKAKEKKIKHKKSKHKGGNKK